MNWIMYIKRGSRDKSEYIVQILMDEGNVEMKYMANIEKLQIQKKQWKLQVKGEKDLIAEIEDSSSDI